MRRRLIGDHMLAARIVGLRQFAAGEFVYQHRERETNRAHNDDGDGILHVRCNQIAVHCAHAPIAELADR